MKRALICLMALLLPLTAVAQPTQPHVDILQIWVSFIASGVVAKECGVSDLAVQQKFLVNLTTVTIRAALAAKERNPSLSDADIKQKMKVVGDGVHESVETEIKTSTCTSPKVQQLLKLYVIQAEMKL